MALVGTGRWGSSVPSTRDGPAEGNESVLLPRPFAGQQVRREQEDPDLHVLEGAAVHSRRFVQLRPRRGGAPQGSIAQEHDGGDEVSI